MNPPGQEEPPDKGFTANIDEQVKKKFRGKHFVGTSIRFEDSSHSTMIARPGKCDRAADKKLKSRSVRKADR